MTTPTTSSTALLSLADLRIWVREEIADADFAVLMIESASEKVRTVAQQPAWTATDAPARARQIASHLAARSFLNPDSVLAEGSIGPLGGDRTVEDMARALHLTAAETAELEAMAPSAASGGGGLWIQPVNATQLLGNGDVYLADSSGSDWMIPYLAADDLPALG